MEFYTYDHFISESHADLSEKKYPEKDYCFVEWLTRVKKLAGIPPTAFYSAENKKIGENYIRFCFIKASSRVIIILKIFAHCREIIQNI
jgi:kynurenine--oxoglutarate transaminase/cysteine-S-conjugate beta-lyase/glutamine--phenylpyruvate transaminase